MKQLTAPKIRSMKGKEKLATLTAYDYFTAKYLDSAGVELLLVGDSVNMVIYGEKTTLTATIEMMCYHTKAVAAGANRAFVVSDMPFLSYHISDEEAIRNAGRLIQAGAGAVKLEGGTEVAPLIKKMIYAGIPVMGHIGMQPQSVNVVGGYRTMGIKADDEKHLIESAKALEEAGCFSVVLEKIKPETARLITESVSIPTIGIGAGPDCDGQILVINDILGLYDEFKPAFVRLYADMKTTMIDAVKHYIDDVKSGSYPNEEEK